MVSSYWNIAYRNLFRHKSFTFLNLCGLVAAIASSILIILYARHELGYDRFHENAERIHLVYKERNTAQGIQELDDTWVPLLEAMRSRYATIVDGARLFEQEGHWVEAEGRKFNERISFADPSLLELFSFPLAAGSAGSALDSRNSMVLSRALAEKYFGDENPIGKTVTLNFNTDYVVTGVLADVPSNSTIRPNILVPFESIRSVEEMEALQTNWGSSFLQTFILLDENTSAENLQGLLPDMVLSLFGTEGPNGTDNMKLKLWSLPSLHDRVTGSDTTARVLLAIAFSIILISCINFMNLSMARSLERAREVGVRKSLGGFRLQIITQFLGEALILSGIAVVLGLALASLLLPLFNSLYGLELVLNPLRDFTLLGVLLGVCLLAALLAGAYPALTVSRFPVVESLRGKLKSSTGGILLRNTLTFLQFAVAIVLMVGLITVWQQIRHMKTQELNFEPDQVVVVPLQQADFADRQAAAGRILHFRNEALSVPGVNAAAFSMSVPGNYQNGNVFATPEGWTREEPLRMLVAVTDHKYFELYRMEFVEGRNFSSELATESNSIIINETAMRDMGWTSAVGKRVNDWTVVGVVKDFHFASLAEAVRPVIHMYRPEDNSAHNYLSLKLQTPDVQTVLARLETLWQDLDPSRPFDYYFIEERFESLYAETEKVSRIVGYFSLLSILIANLGLLGLASYSVVQRTKEVGVRKVFGATVASIVLLLSRQFMKPVVLANLIAWPVAYLAINRWLQGFAYHIDINLLIFPLAGLCVVWLAFATIAGQSFRAATRRPVVALRYE